MLYLGNFSGTLYLYIFRGEPAISGLVKHITSNHRSSHPIATEKGSGLVHDVNRKSPCPWLARPVSGHPPNRKRLVQTWFPYAFASDAGLDYD